MPTAVCCLLHDLSKSAPAGICSSSALHGAEKVNPPVVQTTSGIPYSDVCARNESLAAMAEFRCHQITAWSGMDTTTRLLERKPLNENNFDDISAYIEDARKHPPGRH